MSNAQSDISRDDWLCCAGLSLLVGLLFLGAPVGGAFDWSDAPRHALNGVFVKDFFMQMPFDDPVGFAERYYLQYPALTILFYPPLFYFVSAPFFALFGVSHETALLVVMMHFVAFSCGSYFLFRHWLDERSAFLAAAILSAAPEIAFWGRQVMLEIPALAFVIWSAVCFVSYLRTSSAWLLYVAAALLVLGVYTKISVIFLVAPMFVALLWNSGATLFRYKHAYYVAGLSVVSLVPLVIVTMWFGQANVQSVSGIPDAEVSRLTLDGWLWYAKRLPEQLGYGVLGALLIAAAFALAQRKRQWPDSGLIFMIVWFVAGYLFFSSIDLKESRHTVFLLPPVVLAAAMLIRQVLQRDNAVIALAAVFLTTSATTLLERPVRFVSGYADAAAIVAKRASRNSVVLFSGYRDGSFTFNMRSREDRRDLSVLRADKLLLRIAVRRSIGVEQKLLSENEISALLNRSGVEYVVAQPDFWTDLEAMRRLQAVLRSAQFKPVATVDTPANYPAHETKLIVYRNLAYRAGSREKLKIELPIIGRDISGSIQAQ
jgi:hypothetical protein